MTSLHVGANRRLPNVRDRADAGLSRVTRAGRPAAPIRRADERARHRRVVAVGRVEARELVLVAGTGPVPGPDATALPVVNGLGSASP